MTHRTGITLRLTPADRAALEALQAFTQERTATRAIDIAVISIGSDQSILTEATE